VIKAKLNTGDLGALLRTIRMSADVTQVELSKKLGIPQQNVAQFEAGDRELMLSTMNKYVRALGWELTLTAKRMDPAKPDSADSSTGPTGKRAGRKKRLRSRSGKGV
jgi:transcriptional regulator with XRE-family HTH domain